MTLTIVGGSDASTITMKNDTGYGDSVQDLAGATAGPGCEPDASSTTIVWCKAPDGNYRFGSGMTITVDLGAGNDSFTWYWDYQDTMIIEGGPGNDVISASGGDDVVRGGDGDDRLWGGPGNDTLEGGAGDDTILGHSGDDTITGGLGRDLIQGDGQTYSWGLDGNDTIDVRDGLADNVDCGFGADTVRADAGTTDTFDQLGSCEVINRPVPALRARIIAARTGSKARWLASGFAFRITLSRRCSVVVAMVLPAAEAKRILRKKAVIVLDGGKGSLKAGTYPIKTRPVAKYRKALRAQKHVTTQIVLVCTVGTQRVIARSTVVFR